jgi:hypothetical protein
MTWLEFEPDALAGILGRHVVRVRHRLSEHPILTRPSVIALVDATPPASIEHHLGDLPLVLPDGDPERLSESPGEVARGIDGNGCWMIVWAAQRLPEYRQLLTECVDEVAPFLPRTEGAIEQQAANVLLSSAASVVPVHFDRHHNLLLQIEGTKELAVGSYADPGYEQREINRHFDTRQNAWSVPTEVQTFRLEPGDGLYIPPYQFHWIRGSPTASTALSCEFRTSRTNRAELVHLCNSRARRLHLSPRPPGNSEASDRFKAGVMRTWQKVSPRVRAVARVPRRALRGP